jgi:hypothetical protein
MRLSKVFYAVLFTVALFLVGCATPARYTYEEIKHYPLDVQEWIMKGEISLGMTQQQVRYAWGAPYSIKILESIDGKAREEWVYSTMGVFGTRIVVFIEGKVVYISGESTKIK